MSVADMFRLAMLFGAMVLKIPVLGQSVDLVFSPTSTPVQGSTVQIICQIADYDTSQLASIYRLVSQNDALTSQRLVSTCKTICLGGSLSRQGYIPTRNTTGMYLSITNVARDQDMGWWVCGLTHIVTSDRKLLDVYTSPEGAAYTNQPRNSQDLGLVDVTLSCQTSECAYPATQFTWYYTDSTVRNVYRNSESGVAVSDSSCASHEKKYSSTLTLRRYTEFTGNVRKTTHFQCGLTHATLPNEIFTSQSASITFAVRVTSLILRETSTNVAVGAEVRALIDSNNILTVVWSPVSSNPQPTITCYIGTVSTLLSGSDFTFSVREQDHNKDIYCSATNTISDPISSGSTKLYVIVPLTDVTLTNTGVALETGTEVRVKQGTSVSLELLFTPAVTRPSPSVTCYVGTNEVHTAVQGDTFTITARNEDHGKNIYCQATSTNMIETKIAQLYVIGKPFEPIRFAVTKITSDGFIFLQWDPGFNGGHIQIFTLQYRKCDEDTWTSYLNVTEDDQQYRLTNGSYVAYMSGLGAGIYSLRLISSNSQGRTEGTHIAAAEVPGTFVEHPKSDNTKGEVIGGTLGGFAAGVLVTLGATYLMRRRRARGTGSKSSANRGPEQDVSTDRTVDMHTNLELNVIPETRNESSYQDLTGNRTDSALDYQTLNVSEHAAPVYLNLDPNVTPDRLNDPYYQNLKHD